MPCSPKNHERITQRSQSLFGLNTGGNSIEVYSGVDEVTDAEISQDFSGPVSVVSDGSQTRVIVLTDAVESEQHFDEAVSYELAKNFTIDQVVGADVTDATFVRLRDIAKRSRRVADALERADKALPKDTVAAARAAASELATAVDGTRDEAFVNWALTEFKPNLVNAGWMNSGADFEAVKYFIQSYPAPEGTATNPTGEFSKSASRQGTSQAPSGGLDREAGPMNVYELRGEGFFKRLFQAGKFVWQEGAIPAVKTFQYMFGGQYHVDIVEQLLAQNGVNNNVGFLFMNHHDRVQGRIRQALFDGWRPVRQAVDTALSANLWEDAEVLHKDFDLLATALQHQTRNAAWFLRKVPLKNKTDRQTQRDIINLLLQNQITSEGARERLELLLTDDKIDIRAMKDRGIGGLSKKSTDEEVVQKARNLGSQMTARDRDIVLEQFSEGRKRDALQPVLDAVVAANVRINELYQEAGISGTRQQNLMGLDGIENFITFRDGASTEEGELDENKDNWDFSRYDPFRPLGQAEGRASDPRGLVRATEQALVRAAGLAEAQDFYREFFSRVTADPNVARVLGVEVGPALKAQFNNKKGKQPSISIPGLKNVGENEFVIWQDGQARKVKVGDENLVRALRDMYRPLNTRESHGFEATNVDRILGAIGDFKVGAGNVGLTVGQLTRLQSALLTRLRPTFWPTQVMRDLRQVIPAVATENVGGLNAAMRTASLVFHGPSIAKLKRTLDVSENSIDFEGRLRSLENGSQIDKYMAEFFRSGGASFFAAAQSGLQSANPALLSSADRQISQLNATTNTTGILRSIDGIASRITNTLDNVPRFAAYVALREQGVSVDNAAEFSRGQINFSQTSQMGRYFSDAFAFSNAALAGGYSTYFRRIWRGGRPPVSFIQRNGKTVPVLSAADIAQNLNYPLLAGLALQGFIAYSAWAMMAGDDEDGNANAIRTPNKRFMTGFPMVPVSAVPGFENSQTDFRMPTQYGMDQVMTYIGIMSARMAHGHTTIEGVGDVMANLVMPSMQNAFTATSPVGRLDVTNLTPIDGEDYRPVQDTLLALIPTIFEPMARNTLNRSAFGGPIRPSGGFGSQVRADDSFFTTPEAYRQFALSVREVTASTALVPNIDWNGETYEYYMRSYGGILGEIANSIIEHGNARGYAPHSVVPSPVPLDKSRHYYEVGEKWRQVNRLSRAYTREWEVLRNNSEQRAELAKKNPELERARLLAGRSQRQISKLRKKILEIERTQPRTIQRQEVIVDIKDEIRVLNSKVALEIATLMDKGGDLKR